jgi:hypothetical protein
VDEYHLCSPRAVPPAAIQQQGGGVVPLEGGFVEVLDTVVLLPKVVCRGKMFATAEEGANSKSENAKFDRLQAIVA